MTDLSPSLLDTLERLARGATPGPWEIRDLPNGWMLCPISAKDSNDAICGAEADYDPLWEKAPEEKDRSYIPACSPSVILALIEAARRGMK